MATLSFALQLKFCRAAYTNLHEDIFKADIMTCHSGKSFMAYAMALLRARCQDTDADPAKQ